MTLGSIVQGARRYWISCLLVLAIIAALNWKPGDGEASENEPALESAGLSQPSSPDDDQQARSEALERAIYRNLVQERERVTARSEIEQQLEALDENVEPYEYASRLCALGNLYQQKNGDYVTAAGYYEVLLEDYPDWPGIASAYHQLIVCYKNLNQPIQLRILYRKMLEVFPEGSAEYEFAKSELG